MPPQPAPLTPAILILAGGRGTRLGGADKAFVALAGQPLIEHLIARIPRQSRAIAISANGDAARFASYGLAVLPDGEFAGKGPLAGIAAGLHWAAAIGATSLLSLPVDTPLLPDDLVNHLGPAPSVAEWRGRQHHLVAHWPVSALPALLAFLAAPGAYKVRDALTLLGSRPIDFTAAADPFLNINTPADLALADQALAAQRR